MDHESKKQCLDLESRQELVVNQILLLDEWNRKNIDTKIKEVRENIHTIITLLTCFSDLE